MNELIVIAGLFFTISIGYCILFLFNLLKSHSFLEKMPFAYGLGVGILSWQLFTYSQFHIPWSFLSLFLPWIGIGLYCLVRKPLSLRPLHVDISLSFIDYFLLVCISLTVVYVGFEVWLRPLYAWDGWAIWLIKSKLFFIDGFVNPYIYALLQDSYPYVINLFGTFLYLLMGSSDDRAVLGFFYVFYLMLGLSFYTFLKRNGKTRTKALFFTFLFLSLQNLIRHGGRFEAGYADLPLGFYIFSSFSLFMQYVKDKKITTLILLTIFMAITRLVKEEGLVFCIILQVFMIYFTAFRFKKFSHIALSFLWLLPIFQWELFKYTSNITFTLYTKHIVYPQRFLSVFFYIVKETINIQNWNFLWVAFFLSIPFIFLKKKLILVIPCLLLFFQISSYILVFSLSPYIPSVHVPNVIDRLFLHIAPLAMVVVAVAF